MTGTLLFADGTHERFDRVIVDDRIVRAYDDQRHTTHMFQRDYVKSIDLATEHHDEATR